MILSLSFKRSQSQVGMVLFHTLLVVTLITILILSQITWINLLWQSLHQSRIRHQTFYQLEQMAKKLLHYDMNKLPLHCIIDEMGLDEIQRGLKEGRGCVLHEKQQEYRYFYESLGNFPCLQTIREGQNFGTKHWRLNLMAMGEKFIFLQIRIAVISEEATPCMQEKVTNMNTGIISWQVI